MNDYFRLYDVSHYKTSSQEIGAWSNKICFLLRFGKIVFAFLYLTMVNAFSDSHYFFSRLMGPLLHCLFAQT